MTRKDTKAIQTGDRVIDGRNPALIQSMYNIKTEDMRTMVAQIRGLERVDCDITRVAVSIMEAASALTDIKKEIHTSLVADIHLDYRLAIAAMENEVDEIRTNPGNIGDRHKVQAMVDRARVYGVPIRVGVNSGSPEKTLLEKYGDVMAEGIVESVLDKMKLIEDVGYDNLVISIKSSDVLMCVKVHELIVIRTHYPLHTGIMESGILMSGSIKSSVGLGIILYEGVGDTIHVLLTGDPAEEIKSAKLILRTLGPRKGGIEVVSCPTCGCTWIDLIGLANQAENIVTELDDLDAKVTVMDCVINGPGEVRKADIGIAGGASEGLLTRRGEIIRKAPESELLAILREELLAMSWDREV